jgi:hypothetical protein
MRYCTLALFGLLILAGCPSRPAKPGPADAASVVSDENIGKEITVVGWAVNSKIGALLVGDGLDLWIEDLAGWPDGYYEGGERGKKVKVTGILEQDHGLPVFVPREGEPVVQGIPVEEGTDLEKASLRYVLKNAKWEPVE